MEFHQLLLACIQMRIKWGYSSQGLENQIALEGGQVKENTLGSHILGA